MARIRKMLAAAALALAIAPSAHAVPPIEAYGKLPAISDVNLSPSGGRIAMVAIADEKRTLLVSTTDGKLLQRIELGTIKVRAIEWLGEDHVLVVTTDTVNIGYNTELMRGELATAASLNVNTGSFFQIFGHNHARSVANTIRGFFGAQEVDGHWYGWFGGITYGQDHTSSYLTHGYADLYRVDLDTGDIQIAARGQEDSDEWLVGANGMVLARSLYNERSGVWRILAGRDSDSVIAAGQADFGGAGSLNFGATPDRILVATPIAGEGDDHDARAYRDLSLTGGPERPVPNANEILKPLFDPATRLWIGVDQRNDAREASLMPTALQARWRGTEKAFANRIAHLQSWSTDFNKLVVTTEGGDDSGTYWLVDIAKHAADPIGSDYPDIKSADVGQVKTVDWRAADGLALNGVLTLPPGRDPKSLPLVVLPHGGPEARDYPQFDWWAQAFASRGYAVFQPNFRGSAGFGAAFRNAGLGQWGRKMQTDISDGVADLAKKGIVDPKRACIIGGSYGGYAALAGVTVQHGLYKCAVSVAGVADLESILKYDASREGRQSSPMRYWKAFMGVTSTDDQALTTISPVAQAANADAPILLIHGRNDTVVPIDQSEKMEAALKHAGKPAELVKLDGEDHWLSQEKTRIQMLTAAVAFVQKQNPAN